MSLYHLQKFLYELNRDEIVQSSYKQDIDLLIENYSLSEEEKVALKSGDIGLLYVLGVNGQILMHYAAFLGIEWFDYLKKEIKEKRKSTVDNAIATMQMLCRTFLEIFLSIKSPSNQFIYKPLKSKSLKSLLKLRK